MVVAGLIGYISYPHPPVYPLKVTFENGKVTSIE